MLKPACLAAVLFVAIACGGDNNSTTTAPSPTTTFSLSGRVTDITTGNAISGATISVADSVNTGKSAATDGSGNYAFTDLQPAGGGFTVNVTATHYNSSSKTGVGVAAGPGDVEVLNFALQPTLELTVPSGTTDTFTISGIVTEYLGGPISGVTVSASSGNASIAALTDAQGRYNLSWPWAGIMGIVVWKDGYTYAVKYSNGSSQDWTADFDLHSGIELRPGGDAFVSTIWGDEFMAGDDVLFGGLCVHTACKVVRISAPFVPGRTTQVELRLRWNDPARQLALYVSRVGSRLDFFPIPAEAPPADRYCCSSELVATVRLDDGEADVAVGFERAAGRPPGPADNQPFELAVRPMP